MVRVIVCSECSGKQITDSVVFQVLSLLIWLLTPTEAPPQSNLGLIGGRTWREVDCRDEQEYRSGGICCLNCPAGESPGAKPSSVWPATVWAVLVCALGTYVTSPCRTSGQRGACQECDDGTYMEHTNGLRQCFRCTQCRPGNSGSPNTYSAFLKLVERSLHAQKLLHFLSDQEVLKPCTHTHNTECRCKPGRFCDPDQACELCKKCSRWWRWHSGNV